MNFLKIDVPVYLQEAHFYITQISLDAFQLKQHFQRLRVGRT